MSEQPFYDVAEDITQDELPQRKPSTWSRISLKKLRRRKNSGSVNSDSPKDCQPRGVGNGSNTAYRDSRQPLRAMMPDLARPLINGRRDSERRDRLVPHRLCFHEQRAGSVDRKRALSARPSLRGLHVLIPRRSAPDVRALLSGVALNSNGSHQSGTPTRSNPQQSVESSVVDSDNAHIPSNTPNIPIPNQDNLELDTVSDVVNLDPNSQALLEARWILNLSMHFRDNSDREKFFITYAEQPNLWRRLTVSCDYRDAPPDSLEADLKTLHYQRDKSAKIHEAIKESLLDIQFFDTVTNLKLETAEKRLHVHVTEDINEVIQYPALNAIQHLRTLGCTVIAESMICFESHLSGFVYKVSVNGQMCVKKEIPSPDTVEEFLYEVNALFTLRHSPHIIKFLGVVTDDDCTCLKGLLISFASDGALVDLLFDRLDNPIPWPRREKWARQIVHGLADIHEAGFVQGDFTLSNIVIDSDDNVQIIDINRRGCPMGWEPPELEGLIRSGQRISMYIGVKTDLWQLGMVLWALAMHNAEPEREDEELDFNDEDDNEGIAQVSLSFRNVVRCCLAPDPSERKSALELLRELDRDVGIRWPLGYRQRSPERIAIRDGEFANVNGMAAHAFNDLKGGFGPPLHQDSGFDEGTLNSYGVSNPSATQSTTLYPYHTSSALELMGVGAHADDDESYADLDIEELQDAVS